MAPKAPRREPIDSVELRVFDQCRRRCALCFYIDGDLSEKRGQVAHLDDDRANSAEDNLIFLCLDHHSVYDSATSQHKNYTITETVEARRQLYSAIKEERHLSGSPEVARESVKEADRNTFEHLVSILPSGGAIHFIRTVSLGGGYRNSSIEELRRFEYECSGPEREFIDQALEALRLDLRIKIERLTTLLAIHSFRTSSPGDEIYKVPQAHEFRDHSQWEQILDNIDDAANQVAAAYDTLVRRYRERLL